MLKVGFLSDSYIDPERVGSWSGLPYYFSQNMRAAGCEVVPIRGRDVMATFGEKVRQAAWQFGRGRRYLRGLNPDLLRGYADSVQEPLREADVDIVFSASSWLVSQLETDLPIVFWTDATFSAVLGFYDSFSRLAPPSLAAGDAVERAALERCALAVYSSAWAAQSAVANHGADPAKVRVLPLGANLEHPPEPAAVEADITRRAASTAVCELLLIGVDWRRKGVDVAVSALEELRRLGVPARLRIAGCEAPRGVRLPAGVEVLGFIDKASVTGRRQLEELYRISHFFLLPSRAEAFGVVLSEACAFGVPCLSANVGGLSDVIVDGVNGQLFPPTAVGADYARWLAGVWREPGRYRALALGASEAFQTRLSGELSGRRLTTWMEDLLPAARLVTAA